MEFKVPSDLLTTDASTNDIKTFDSVYGLSFPKSIDVKLKFIDSLSYVQVDRSITDELATLCTELGSLNVFGIRLIVDLDFAQEKPAMNIHKIVFNEISHINELSILSKPSIDFMVQDICGSILQIRQAKNIEGVGSFEIGITVESTFSNGELHRDLPVYCMNCLLNYSSLGTVYAVNSRSISDSYLESISSQLLYDRSYKTHQINAQEVKRKLVESTLNQPFDLKLIELEILKEFYLFSSRRLLNEEILMAPQGSKLYYTGGDQNNNALVHSRPSIGDLLKVVDNGLRIEYPDMIYPTRAVAFIGYLPDYS